MLDHVDRLRAGPPRAGLRVRVAGCTVSIDANAIERDGLQTRVTPKAMGVLRQLLLAAPRTVGREELLATVWADGCPSDEVVTQSIAELRRALGEGARDGRCIETIPRVGYRLRAAIEWLPDAALADAGGDATTTSVAASDPIGEQARERSSQAPAAATAQPSAREALPAPVTLGADQSRRARWPWLVGAILIGAVVVSLTQLVSTPTAADAGSSRSLSRPVTAAPGREQFASLSPDGSLVAYGIDADTSESAGIHVQGLAVSDRALIVSSPPRGANDRFPVWFPDASRIAFLRTMNDACAIMVMPALGGTLREVGSCYARTVDYFDVSADGAQLLVARLARDLGIDAPRTLIARLDLASGALAPVDYAPHADDEHDIEPKASPDGRWIAFRRGIAPYSSLWVMPAAGGTARALVERRARVRGLAWYPDSSALLVSADYDGPQQLHRVPLTGDSIQALDVLDSHFPSVARNRPLAVATSERQVRRIRELALIGDRFEPGRETTRASRSDDMPAYAPDGRRFAFVSRRSGSPEVWLHDFETGIAEPLTEIGGPELEWPQWAPDGRAIVFVQRDAESALMRVDLASRRVQRLSAPGVAVRFGSFSRDGRTIWHSVLDDGRWSLWRMDVDGGAARRVAANGALDPRQPLDEEAVYYIKDVTWGLYRHDLVSGAETELPVPVGLFARSMYALREDGLWFVDSPGPELPLALFHQPDWRVEAAADTERAVRLVAEVPRESPLGQVAIAPDASRLLLVDTVHDETDVVAVELR